MENELKINDQEKDLLLKDLCARLPYGEWRVIPDYPNYAANSLGKIANIKTGKLRKFSNHKGYVQCMVRKDGKSYNKFVHRLIANAFLPTPQEGQVIDHINGIRDDNRVENLRWCSVDENLHFPLAIKNREHLKKQCSQYHLDGTLITSFNSVFEAATALNLNSGAINNCCIGRKLTCGGFQWRYGCNDTNIEAVRKNKRNIQVAQCDELGNIIKTYPSCNSAAKSNGLTHQVINECVNGKRKSAYGGFIWKKLSK